MATVADRLFLRRRIVNALSLVFSGLAALFGMFWLVWILWTTFTKGVDAMSLSLFTEMTPPPGPLDRKTSGRSSSSATQSST